MSRYRSAGSHSQSVSNPAWGCYRLHWTVDRYYAGSRLRHPRSCHRDIDLAGTVKFALRHGCYRMPDDIRALVTAARIAAYEAKA